MRFVQLCSIFALALALASQPPQVLVDPHTPGGAVWANLDSSLAYSPSPPTLRSNGAIPAALNALPQALIVLPGSTAPIWVQVDLSFTLDQSTTPPTLRSHAGVGSPAFVTEEVPQGALDKKTVSFSLVNAPEAGSLTLYGDGLRLASSLYTLTGNVITFSAPPGATELVASYRY